MTAGTPRIDVETLRSAFPILDTTVPGPRGQRHPLRYLDHAASTHAPTPVLEAVHELMATGYANVHRGNHHLSRSATDAFEAARAQMLTFFGADASHATAVFTHNTTSALDLAAHVMASVPGDTVISHLEHHSNDLPHRRRGRVHRVDPHGDVGSLPERIEAVLGEHRVKLVAVTGASNVTGERPDVHAIARVAHAHGARILVDAAQLAAHVPIDVGSPDDGAHLDFVAAAGHKAYAPFGSAVLVGPTEVFDAAPPYMPGGGTVLFVGREEATFTRGPERHEGGTPNVVGAVAFAAATRWLERLGRDRILAAEEALARHARKRLAEVDGLTAYQVGGAAHRLGVFPFLLDGWHHAELASALDAGWGIATRDGCFCAHPLMIDLLGVDEAQAAAIRQAMITGDDARVPGLVRASLGVYNTHEEVDVLAEALRSLARRGPEAAAAVPARTTL